MRIEAKSLAAIEGIGHGFFTREGGMSGGIYASLNCGLGSKDDPAHVAENRRRVAKELGTDAPSLVSPYQLHSAAAVVAEQPWTREDAPRVDAVVTAKPGLAIAVSTADCVPVLFADAETAIIGAAHAGWRGALSGVLEAALEAMETLGANRSRVTAAIGPAISQAAYEVGEEFERQFLDEDIGNARFFVRPDPASRPHFDLTGYVAARLESANVAHVETLEICTYSAEDRLFSYRRACHRGESDYGRQISAIVIPR
jgi:YfiH family protein